jgi:tRNA U34 2-thiouridine synthase MnmA/TrmU
MVKEISLTQGKVTIVDDEDYDRVNQHKWHAAKHNRNWYARRKDPKTKKIIRMSRFILGFETNLICDHINRNGLDNRKENLRLATKTQNLMNSKKRKNTSSKYKGVSLYKRYNKWESKISVNKKLIHIGLFNYEVDAARAYDMMAKIHFGEFANLNFPP